MAFVSFVTSNLQQLRSPAVAFEISETLKFLSSNVVSNIGFDSSSIGEGISSVITKVIEGFDANSITGTTGEKMTEAFDAFLKSFDTSKMAGDTGEKLNDGFQSFWDGANVGDAATRAGEEFKEGIKGFTKEAGKGINLGIRNTVGEAASAVSWSVLPYVALGTIVATGLPLTLFYLYYRAKHYIGSPKLATEVRQLGIFSLPTDTIFGSKKPKPVYNAEITRRVTDLTNSVKNIRKNSGNFQNVLFYGPGGTGKTMISDYIARNSGMSYVKMSGGDLAQYIKRGEHVTELNKLLDKMETSWRPWSNRPWILFIDEAESFCRDRSKIPRAELIELQNAFLNRTGTSDQSKKFMLILATNRMEDLDEAVLSRMDHKIFIGPPEQKERRDIVASYVPQFFSKSEQAEFFGATQLDQIAAKTDGLTGRAIFKLLNAVSGKKAATSDFKLTQEMIDGTINDVMAQEAEVIRRRELKEQAETRHLPVHINQPTPVDPSKPLDQPVTVDPVQPINQSTSTKTEWEKMSQALRKMRSRMIMPF
ncbi:MAG: AAA family ATPase [Rhabdochlamydiaceae bacterium]|nr:AAA family ATPase [Rhabdochlamydiaceae bacterium]